MAAPAGPLLYANPATWGSATDGVDLFKVTTTGGTVQVSTVRKRPGRASSILITRTTAADVSCRYFSGATGMPAYGTYTAATHFFWINCSALPTGSDQPHIIEAGVLNAAPWDVYVDLDSSGNLTLFDGSRSAVFGTIDASDTWHLIEVQIDVSTATHSYKAKLDGGAPVTLTYAGAAATAARGGILGPGSGSVAGTWTISFQDFGLVDGLGWFTDAGNPNVYDLAPDAGAADLDTAWAITGTGVTKRADAIDERPPDDATTYISSTTNGQVQRVELATVALASGFSCYGVQLFGRAGSNGATGTRNITATIQNASGTDSATSFTWSALINGWQRTNAVCVISSPPGGGSWTQTAVDGLRFKATTANASSAAVRLTAAGVWLVVVEPTTSDSTVSSSQGAATAAGQTAIPGHQAPGTQGAGTGTAQTATPGIRTPATQGGATGAGQTAGASSALAATQGPATGGGQAGVPAAKVPGSQGAAGGAGQAAATHSDWLVTSTVGVATGDGRPSGPAARLTSPGGTAAGGGQAAAGAVTVAGVVGDSHADGRAAGVDATTPSGQGTAIAAGQRATASGSTDSTVTSIQGTAMGDGQPAAPVAGAPTAIADAPAAGQATTPATTITAVQGTATGKGPPATPSGSSGSTITAAIGTATADGMTASPATVTGTAVGQTASGGQTATPAGSAGATTGRAAAAGGAARASATTATGASTAAAAGPAASPVITVYPSLGGATASGYPVVIRRVAPTVHLWAVPRSGVAIAVTPARGVHCHPAPARGATVRAAPTRHTAPTVVPDHHVTMETP